MLPNLNLVLVAGDLCIGVPEIRFVRQDVGHATWDRDKVPYRGFDARKGSVQARMAVYHDYYADAFKFKFLIFYLALLENETFERPALFSLQVRID